MKQKIIIAVSLLLFGTTSCQRERCWMCYDKLSPVGALQCDMTRREIKDLENAYYDMGIVLECELKK
jgi:hypothetical protein